MPETFDASFEAGEISATDALACSTMGLKRLVKDMNGIELGTSHFLEVVPAIASKTGLWPRRNVRVSHQPNALKLIRDNRIFGRSAGEKDVLWTEHPEDAMYIDKTGYDWTGFTPVENSAYGSYQVLEALCGKSEVQRMGDLAVLRRGVQVIYGGEDMLTILQEQAAPDGNYMTAWKREQRMPVEFVTAILPLGEYEQAELLSDY